MKFISIILIFNFATEASVAKLLINYQNKKLKNLYQYLLCKILLMKVREQYY